MPQIVLVEPEIPPNTGNIARTCAATETPLHLVEPLGFEINDRQLKRAGLDYWPHVPLVQHKSWNDFHLHQQHQGGRLLGFSRHAKRSYLDTATITQQEKDATEALNGQASMQQTMLSHQYAALQAYVLMDSNRTSKKSGVNVSMNHS